MSGSFFGYGNKIFPQGYEIAIIANIGAGDLSFKEVKEELSEIILDKKKGLRVSS